jgi:hypothetical protein
VLRFNSRPKFYTDALSSLVVSIVPWGVVCHLVMALWILGNKGVLNSGPLDLSQVWTVWASPDLIVALSGDC